VEPAISIFMTTPQQPGADRAHPNRSTGPRSAAGKARSSMNALKTGIYSKSLVIPGEDPAHLTALTEEYFQRFLPAVPEQRDLVDILVRSTWTLRRLAVAEAQLWTYEIESFFNPDTDTPIGHAFHNGDRALTRLQRYVSAIQRNYRDALRELSRLQAQDLDVPPPNPQPTSVAAPQLSPQPTETEPVNPSRQFVPSSSAPPPPAAQMAASKAPKKPLPFHLPGSNCYFDPIDPAEFQQCPFCFPPK
jgi:hypothetical protein